MNWKVLLLASMLVFAFGAVASAQNNAQSDIQQILLKSPNDPDPGIPDTVIAQSLSVPFGQSSFAVEVYLYNDEDLGGFNLPIAWDSPDIVCDSVSWIGSRVDYVNFKLFSIDTVNQQLQAGMIIVVEPQGYLQPGRGLVYTAHFSLLPGAAAQIINYDSAFYPPAGEFALTLSSGFNIFPQFVPGQVTYGNPQPTISLSPLSFDFSAVAGGPDPAAQTLTITNTGAGTLNWTATKKSTWLTLDPPSGTGDASVSVSASITGLAAGTYFDTITVSDPAATNDPQKAPVTLTIEEPPLIVLSPTDFSYTITVGDPLADDQLNISNGGGGTLDWTAANVSGWLTLNPTSGTGDGIVTLSFDVAALGAGTYYDTITVSDPNAANTPQKAPVTVTVVPPPTIDLAPTSFSYMIVGGETLPDDQLSISNSGGGVLNWTAANLSDWLTLTPTSGTGDGVVTLSFAVSGLGPGTYHDTITVSDPKATNDPQTAAVMLTVEAPPTISVTPTEFIFDLTEGDPNPPPATLTINNSGDGELNWTVTKTQDWLTLDPTSGVAGENTSVTVDISGLVPDTYYDTISVIDPDASNSPVLVPVTVNIEALPVIVLDPTGFDYTITRGETLADAQLAVTNGGGGTLDWSASNLSAWLSLNPTSGTGDGLITISFDVSGLAVDEYHDTITVTATGATNSPQKVPVMLTVKPQPPVIALDPTSITLTAVVGDAIPDEQISVTNAGENTLEWSATNQTGWITLSPTAGVGDGVITLSFDITGVGPGQHIDTITVSDPDATNSPQYSVVTLTVIPDADTVYVETVDAIPGEQVIVDVNYTNFTITWAFTLPLNFNPAVVVCDSVSFVGSRIFPVDESVAFIDNTEGTIAIIALSMGGPILAPGSGLIAKMFFTVDPGATQQFMPIDSMFIDPPGYAFEFTDESGGVPKKTEFFSGGIDITATPCFDFPTDTVAFEIDLGGPVPSISFLITNACGGILEWSVTDDADWLTITPASGTQGDVVTFKVDTTGLGPGAYVATATFVSNGENSPFDVIVTLNLTERPSIALSPALVDLGPVCQGSTASGTFDILQIGPGPMEWQADALELVALSTYSGTGSTTVTFDVYTETLDYGDNTLEVIVTSDDAINSPQVLTIHIFILNCGECSIDIAEAYGPQGSTAVLPVFATGLANVAGVQFHIAFDSAVVTADSVTSGYMFDATVGITDHKIHFIWDDIYNPITVPDGDPIILLWFTVIGDIGEIGCMEWVGNNEVVDPTGVVFENLIYCSGCILVVEPFFDLSGTIGYYNMFEPVADVTVDLAGDATASTMTDQDGAYAFTDLGAGMYSITPSRGDNDPGVSVGDAVKIRRHLAFLEEFDSPYKMIAADVSLNDTVSVADVILIRRFLAELDDLPSGNWTFVDAAYPIGMDDWWEAPRMIGVILSYMDLYMLDFVGVRMGDANASWPLSVPAPGSQYVGVELTIPNLVGAPSDDIMVPVLVANFIDVAGVEIHITYDMNQLSVDSITSSHLADPTINAIDGRAHLIWEDIVNPVTLDDGDTLMLIHFHVMPTAGGSISLAFMPNCELVDEIGDPFGLSLVNGSLDIEPTGVDDEADVLPTEFSLKQNYPNPFNPATVITYSVDRAMELVFEVYNVSGQLIDRIDLGHKSPGIYSFTYRANGLASGVYTYRLMGEGVSTSRQMLLVK